MVSISAGRLVWVFFLALTNRLGSGAVAPNSAAFWRKAKTLAVVQPVEGELPEPDPWLEPAVPAHPGDIVLGVSDDLVEGHDVPLLIGCGTWRPVFAGGTEQQERVAGVELGGGAGEVEATATGWGPGDSGGDRQRVPVGFGQDIGGCLEALGGLVLRRHALHLGAGGDGDRRGAWVGRQAGGGFQGEREVGLAGDAGGRLVADEAGQFSERAKLCGRAKVALVGKTLLVEGQDVEDDRAGVEQGNAEIVGVTCLEVAQGGVVGAGKARQHGFAEGAPGAGAIGDGGKSGQVLLDNRGLNAGAGAAAAGAGGGVGAAQGHITCPPQVSA